MSEVGELSYREFNVDPIQDVSFVPNNVDENNYFTNNFNIIRQDTFWRPHKHNDNNKNTKNNKTDDEDWDDKKKSSSKYRNTSSKYLIVEKRTYEGINNPNVDSSPNRSPGSRFMNFSTDDCVHHSQTHDVNKRNSNTNKQQRSQTTLYNTSKRNDDDDVGIRMFDVEFDEVQDLLNKGKDKNGVHWQYAGLITDTSPHLLPVQKTVSIFDKVGPEYFDLCPMGTIDDADALIGANTSNKNILKVYREGTPTDLHGLSHVRSSFSQKLKAIEAVKAKVKSKDSMNWGDGLRQSFVMHKGERVNIVSPFQCDRDYIPLNSAEVRLASNIDEKFIRLLETVKTKVEVAAIRFIAHDQWMTALSRTAGHLNYTMDACIRLSGIFADQHKYFSFLLDDSTKGNARTERVLGPQAQRQNDILTANRRSILKKLSNIYKTTIKQSHIVYPQYQHLTLCAQHPHSCVSFSQRTGINSPAVLAELMELVAGRLKDCFMRLELWKLLTNFNINNASTVNSNQANVNNPKSSHDSKHISDGTVPPPSHVTDIETTNNNTHDNDPSKITIETIFTISIEKLKHGQSLILKMPFEAMRTIYTALSVRYRKLQTIHEALKRLIALHMKNLRSEVFDRTVCRESLQDCQESTTGTHKPLTNNNHNDNMNVSRQVTSNTNFNQVQHCSDVHLSVTRSKTVSSISFDSKSILIGNEEFEDNVLATSGCDVCVSSPFQVVQAYAYFLLQAAFIVGLSRVEVQYPEFVGLTESAVVSFYDLRLADHEIPELIEMRLEQENWAQRRKTIIQRYQEQHANAVVLRQVCKRVEKISVLCKEISELRERLAMDVVGRATHMCTIENHTTKIENQKIMKDMATAEVDAARDDFLNAAEVLIELKFVLNGCKKHYRSAELLREAASELLQVPNEIWSTELPVLSYLRKLSYEFTLSDGTLPLPTLQFLLYNNTRFKKGDQQQPQVHRRGSLFGRRNSTFNAAIDKNQNIGASRGKPFFKCRLSKESLCLMWFAMANVKHRLYPSIEEKRTILFEVYTMDAHDLNNELYAAITEESNISTYKQHTNIHTWRKQLVTLMNSHPFEIIRKFIINKEQLYDQSTYGFLNQAFKKQQQQHEPQKFITSNATKTGDKVQRMEEKTTNDDLLQPEKFLFRETRGACIADFKFSMDELFESELDKFLNVTYTQDELSVSSLHESATKIMRAAEMYFEGLNNVMDVMAQSLQKKQEELASSATSFKSYAATSELKTAVKLFEHVKIHFDKCQSILLSESGFEQIISQFSWKWKVKCDQSSLRVETHWKRKLDLFKRKVHKKCTDLFGVIDKTRKQLLIEEHYRIKSTHKSNPESIEHTQDQLLSESELLMSGLYNRAALLPGHYHQALDLIIHREMERCEQQQLMEASQRGFNEDDTIDLSKFRRLSAAVVSNTSRQHDLMEVGTDCFGDDFYEDDDDGINFSIDDLIHFDADMTIVYKPIIRNIVQSLRVGMHNMYCHGKDLLLELHKFIHYPSLAASAGSALGVVETHVARVDRMRCHRNILKIATDGSDLLKKWFVDRCDYRSWLFVPFCDSYDERNAIGKTMLFHLRNFFRSKSDVEISKIQIERSNHFFKLEKSVNELFTLRGYMDEHEALENTCKTTKDLIRLWKNDIKNIPKEELYEEPSNIQINTKSNNNNNSNGDSDSKALGMRVPEVVKNLEMKIVRSEHSWVSQLHNSHFGGFEFQQQCEDLFMCKPFVFYQTVNKNNEGHQGNDLAAFETFGIARVKKTLADDNNNNNNNNNELQQHGANDIFALGSGGNSENLKSDNDVISVTNTESRESSDEENRKEKQIESPMMLDTLNSHLGNRLLSMDVDKLHQNVETVSLAESASNQISTYSGSVMDNQKNEDDDIQSKENVVVTDEATVNSHTERNHQSNTISNHTMNKKIINEPTNKSKKNNDNKRKHRMFKLDDTMDNVSGLSTERYINSQLKHDTLHHAVGVANGELNNDNILDDKNLILQRNLLLKPPNHVIHSIKQHQIANNKGQRISIKKLRKLILYRRYAKEKSNMANVTITKGFLSDDGDWNVEPSSSEDEEEEKLNIPFPRTSYSYYIYQRRLAAIKNKMMKDTPPFDHIQGFAICPNGLLPSSILHKSKKDHSSIVFHPTQIGNIKNNKNFPELRRGLKSERSRLMFYQNKRINFYAHMNKNIKTTTTKIQKTQLVVSPVKGTSLQQMSEKHDANRKNDRVLSDPNVSPACLNTGYENDRNTTSQVLSVRVKTPLTQEHLSSRWLKVNPQIISSGTAHAALMPDVHNTDKNTYGDDGDANENLKNAPKMKLPSYCIRPLSSSPLRRLQSRRDTFFDMDAKVLSPLPSHYYDSLTQKSGSPYGKSLSPDHTSPPILRFDSPSIFDTEAGDMPEAARSYLSIVEYNALMDREEFNKEIRPLHDDHHCAQQTTSFDHRQHEIVQTLMNNPHLRVHTSELQRHKQQQQQQQFRKNSECQDARGRPAEIGLLSPKGEKGMAGSKPFSNTKPVPPLSSVIIKNTLQSDNIYKSLYQRIKKSSIESSTDNYQPPKDAWRKRLNLHNNVYSQAINSVQISKNLSLSPLKMDPSTVVDSQMLMHKKLDMDVLPRPPTELMTAAPYSKRNRQLIEHQENVLRQLQPLTDRFSAKK